jgi:hypothetical protein
MQIIPNAGPVLTRIDCSALTPQRPLVSRDQATLEEPSISGEFGAMGFGRSRMISKPHSRIAGWRSRAILQIPRWPNIWRSP